MTTDSVERRQLVDWRAAVWGGLAAGLSFLAVEAILTALLLGDAWLLLPYTAAIVMGESVLPPAALSAGTAITALVLHFVLSLIFGGIIALVIHRGGLITGIIGGALLGLAFYAINYYTFSYLFPWFFAIRTWIIVLGHVVFGAVAGGVYEALEREQYILVHVEKDVDHV